MVGLVLETIGVLFAGVLAGAQPAFVFRVAGLAALAAFVLFSFLGTVPINIRVDDWDAELRPWTGSRWSPAGSSSTCSVPPRRFSDSSAC